MSEPLELEVVESRPNPWVTGFAATPFAVLLVVAVAALAKSDPFLLILTPHLLFFGIFTTLWARLKRPYPMRVPVRATVDEQGVTLDDGKRSQRVERITRGAKVPSTVGASVQLDPARGRKRQLSFASDDEADALLEKLGLDVRATSASFRGMPRTFTSLWRVYGTMFGTMLAMVFFAVVAGIAVGGAGAASVFAFGFVALLTLMLAPSRIEVGGDGVLVQWLGRTRFIRHADIRSVRVQHTGFGNNKWESVELLMVNGEAARIPVARFDENAARILAQRILDAKKAVASGPVAPTAMLQRSKRSHREWVQALRKREVTDLRSPAVPKDHLWPVIEDPSTDALERAAAVVALGREVSDAERKRLARVAKAVAAPKLRVVLEDGPDAEEDELVEMLEKIEAELPEASA